MTGYYHVTHITKSTLSYLAARRRTLLWIRKLHISRKQPILIKCMWVAHISDVMDSAMVVYLAVTYTNVCSVLYVCVVIIIQTKGLILDRDILSGSYSRLV